MWLNDSTQTVETTSFSPWNMEQQNRWASGGAQYNGLASCDERLRAIVPPAFRNSNAKVVWQDSKSLEANVNEALGISNCYGALSSQYSEQNCLNGSVQNSYPNGGSVWNQNDTVRSNLWEYNGASPTPIPNGFNAPILGNNALPPKGWCGPEDQWDNISKRNVSFAYAPPPAFNNPANNGWQQNNFRNFPLPGARFTGATPYDGNMVNGPNMQSSGMPSPVGAPPQRSRLQSLWNAGPPTNNVMAGICVPPPNRDYNMMNSSGSFMSSNGVNGMNYGVPKAQYGPPFNNSVSSQLPVGPVNPSATSNSFMGEDSMWQDPNQELRKWQRDTGTAIWGDPEKQTSEIHRWLPPIEDDEVQSNDSDPKRKKIVVMGWGDAPASFNSSKSSVGPNSGISSIGQPNWVRKSSQPLGPTSNALFDSSVLNKALSSQTLNKITSVLCQDELASFVAAVQLNSAMNIDGGLASNVPFNNGLSGMNEPLKNDMRDYTLLKMNVSDNRSKSREMTVGNGLAALSEAATATMPRFGDSLLEVTTGLDQPKSLFSF
uniref:M_domain domain-containing protein n=1 Tax=Syphacia muris TaxID=451379 RepID=A0A0N5ADR6_9BILA